MDILRILLLIRKSIVGLQRSSVFTLRMIKAMVGEFYGNMNQIKTNKCDSALSNLNQIIIIFMKLLCHKKDLHKLYDLYQSIDAK